jgi:hypothetical protein
MFCTPGLIFDGTEGIGSLFHVLRARTRFRRYRGRLVPFSCFLRLDSFFVVPMASDPVFIFCAPELVFGGTEGVGSRFHILHAQTRFQQYRGRRVPFSSFALPESFSTVSSALGPVSMFCAPVLVYSNIEGVGSRFQVFRSRARFRQYRGSRGPVYMFCAPGLVFGGTVGVGSRFHVLRSRINF